ncbi:hypothetical protein BGE01nite_43990 [Brevifollis gellanilyticus]|uniref:Uncharacterized protein n=2 Tax=Brevifollis gellanilyticus TaxID=748831 RepID=A0A512MEH4_9BACT|nr:hypothetical protein BGE01nite_43990 [Brevifollis gellanilyticus]
MTTRLTDGENEWDVAESWVYLEIANQSGRVVTLRRKVAGEGGQDRRVIDVWEGSVLSQDSLPQASKSYFARDPGSAQREAGFGHWLAEFVGWDLPQVMQHDGSLCPLYAECLMPTFFIEQSQGWTGIQAATPKVFGIRQVEKKAIEFILAMDVCKTDSEKEKLEQETDELTKQWSTTRTQLEVIARVVKGALREIPHSPQAQWPPVPAPFVETFQEGIETSLDEAIRIDQAALERLDSVEIPTADEASNELADQLSEATEELAKAESIWRSLEDELEGEKVNLGALETRLATVEEDLVRNKDTKKLRDFGAANTLSITNHECPTCRQQIQDALLSQTFEQEVMGIDENIAYLAAQRQTLDKIHAQTNRAIAALQRRIDAVVNHSNELRARIRYLKRTLVSSGIAPSEAAVRERVVTDQRLSERINAKEEFERIIHAFPPLAKRWTELQANLKKLKSKERTKDDLNKLAELFSRFITALSEFGFDSFPLETVKIDHENYRPKREGFDLGYSVSASDLVRIIAAYATALLEVARTYPTNHPGLLLLDEPRQQNMQWKDFAEILKRLSRAGEFGQQVIVATSDRPEAIEELMRDIPHSRMELNYDDRLLKPVGIRETFTVNTGPEA